MTSTVSDTYDLDKQIALKKAELDQLISIKKRELDDQIALKQADLDQLSFVIKALNAPFEQVKNITNKSNSKNLVEIPKSVDDLNQHNYIIFIVNHLKSEPNGLSISEFCEKVGIAIGTPFQESAIYKKLYRYFTSMAAHGELVKEVINGKHCYKLSESMSNLGSEALKFGNYKYRNNAPHTIRRENSIANRYATVLVDILQNEKAGLDFKNIRLKMREIMGDDIDTRYLAVQICNMAKNGSLIKEGKRNSYKYKVIPSI